MTGKVLVDRAAVLDLIDQIRGALPDDLQHAEEVLRSQEQLLAEARDAAQRIRTEAEASLRLRLDEHELTRAAREQARQIVDQSQQQAGEVVARAQEEAVARRKELDEYSLTLLRRLEASLTAQLANVRTGIDAIIQGGGRGPGAPEDR